MNPNAIGRHTQQQKDQAVQQLTALKASTIARREVQLTNEKHLSTAVEKIESIGVIPGIGDIRKIADAIKHMAMAQRSVTQFNIAELTAQVTTLDDGIKAANSSVIPVHIGG